MRRYLGLNRNHYFITDHDITFEFPVFDVANLQEPTAELYWRLRLQLADHFFGVLSTTPKLSLDDNVPGNFHLVSLAGSYGN